jgi:membrane protease subunit HflC
VEFFEFTRTMQAYGDMISDDTTLVLTTDSDLFRFFRGLQTEALSVREPASDTVDGG